MKIEPFIPINTLIKATKVSPTYVEQGDVLVTSDSLKEAIGGTTKIVKTFSPQELQTMGSSPLSIYDKENLIPFFIVMNLTTGTTPYDFGVGDYFQFNGSGGIFFESVYPLQTIQNDEFVVGYSRSEFKINTLGTPPFGLFLTTINGNDATQGDGVLTVYCYCLSL
jgi:hypothetical protein